MIVMKFGGSSLKSAERIKQMHNILAQRLTQEPILVLSAIGGVTDLLLSFAKNSENKEVDSSNIVGLHHNIASELGLNPKSTELESLNELLDNLSGILKGISLLKQSSPQVEDLVVSFGERLSVRLVTAYLKSKGIKARFIDCLLYTSPSPRDATLSRMPSSA